MAQAYVTYQSGDWDADSTWANIWVTATVIAIGTFRRPISTNGYTYECTARSGDFKTGALEPAWPTTIGNTVVDNHVTWTCRDKYPNQTTIGQTFTIGSAHTVKYNVSSTVELAASTINGVLYHSSTSSTLIQFGAFKLTISATGYYKIGTLGTIIPKQYTAKCLFNSNADGSSSQGLSITSGGSFYCYGDPSYYGGDETQQYIRAITVSYSGTSLVVEGDYHLWNLNDVLYIYRNNTYNNYLTDIVPLQIDASTAPSYNAGTGNTTIIVQQTASGVYNAGGYVWHVTRNVIVSKVIATVEPLPIINVDVPFAFTNRPAIRDLNTTVGNVKVHSVSFIGLIYINCTVSSGWVGADVVLRTCGSGFMGHKKASITSGIAVGSGSLLVDNFFSYFGVDVVATSGGFSGSNANCTLSGEMCCFNSYTGSSYGVTLTGNVMGGGFGINGGYGDTTFIGSKFYNNRYISYQDSAQGIVFDTCTFGYDIKNVSRPNTCDLRLNNGGGIQFVNCKNPSAGLVWLLRGTSLLTSRYRFDAYAQTPDEYRILDGFGTLQNVLPDGGSLRPNIKDIIYTGKIEQIFSESTCADKYSLLTTIDPNKHKLWCTGGKQISIRYYVQSLKALTGNADPSLSNFYLSASYLDGTTITSRSMIYSTQSISIRSNNNDWSQYIEAIITPTYDGYVYLGVILQAYINSASEYLWLWPVPYVRKTQTNFADVPFSLAVSWGGGDTSLITVADSQLWNITISNPTTVGAYTGISINHVTKTVTLTAPHTEKELYDYAQYNLCDASNRGYVQWLKTIDGIGYTTAYSIINNSTLTGGGSINVGSNTYTGSGTYDGIIITSTDRKVHLALNGLVAGSTVQIYDNIAATEIYNAVVAGTALDYIFTWTVNHSLRIRVRQAGWIPYEYTGDITETGLVLNVSQSIDNVYVANGIDGSTVSELYLYDSTLIVYISSGSNTTTGQRLYNGYMYQIARPTFIGLQPYDITAQSAWSYILADALKIYNAGASPLFISGANINNVSGNGQVIDTTGGEININGYFPFNSANDIAVVNRVEMDSNSSKLKTILGLSAAAASK